MTCRCGHLLTVPVWQLTACQKARMCKPHAVLAADQLGFLKLHGHLALILANPPGTHFETVWDNQGKQWVLKPLPPITTKPRKKTR